MAFPVPATMMGVSDIAVAAKRRIRRAAVSVWATAHGALNCSPRSSILIMGHMRSGSTLLLHLLMSHSQIIGCGERNTAYRAPRDLDRLAVESRLRAGSLLRAYQYAADQINHTRFTPVERLLDHARVRLLFLVREPEPTIASIIAVAGRYYPSFGWTVERAAAYYMERLHALERIASGLANPASGIFLTHDDLVRRSVETLHLLERYLNLAESLSPRYDLQEFTGRRGDPMDGVRRGRIDPLRPDRRIELPEEVLARVRASHASCVTVLRRFVTFRSLHGPDSRADARPISPCS